MTHNYKGRKSCKISRFKQVAKSEVRKVATKLNKIRKQTQQSLDSMAYDIGFSYTTLGKVFNRHEATEQTMEKIYKYLEWTK